MASIIPTKSHTDKQSLSPTVHLLAGAASGLISTILFQPLDVAKTKLQQGSIIGSRRKLLHVITDITRTQGISSLWRGTLPSIYRTVPGMALYFSLLNQAKKIVIGYNNNTKAPRTLTPSQNFVISFLSRVAIVTTFMPLLVVKTRIESSLFTYHSTMHALMTMTKQEGLRSLMYGLGPTIMRDAPFSALYYSLYQQGKRFLDVHQEALKDIPPPALTFICGATAGAMATILTHPPDVLRTRMQLCSCAEKQSFTQTAASLWAREGVKGFCAGIVPRVLRKTLQTALVWTLYEEILTASTKLYTTLMPSAPIHTFHIRD